jgi:hypothetical protein
MTDAATIDTSGRFTKFLLAEGAQKIALDVSPVFLVYLQNKIAEYAEAVLDQELPYDPDPAKQVKAILAHERLRNFVEAYQELLNEIIAGQTAA